MKIRVPYGRTSVAAEVPADFPVDVVELPEVPVVADPIDAVRRALLDPVGGFRWPDHAPPPSVAIAINDKTRPVPHQHLLPPLLERLAEMAIPTEAITFYIAVGGHPPMERSEFGVVLPAEIAGDYQVVSHDSEDSGGLVFLGDTSRGTPVWVNRGYVGAALKIVVGTIEPHQFVGFSGGVKSAAIGLAGLVTINANHSLMVHPDSVIGTYTTNPARRDVEEIGALIGVDLALNAVLGPEREIVEVIAGDPVAVMEAGTSRARKHAQVAVPCEYAVVIASPGGHPKDINVYQSQKAVSSAARIVRSGGTIILTAACPEGAGSVHYEDWVASKRSRDEVVEAFRDEGFRLGPHKAFQIARDTERARLIVCSEMSSEQSAQLLLDPVIDLQTGVDMAVSGLEPGDKIAVLPHAASTIPYLSQNSTGGTDDGR